MNVFGIGLPEMAVIGAVALLVFGPKRLPELGRTLGKTLKGFQSASKEFEREINKAMAEPELPEAGEVNDVKVIPSTASVDSASPDIASADIASSDIKASNPEL
ncbi:TatA/E family twin arginine-targeting protein translocase [Synechococcus sp. HK01-R]|uniref:TatA/E family twin arginine-targeting protein translocase n=1 Tax=Synechococcus sp. HK01-R TaxID=2751171 RepID=UPI0016242820|nr:TatA/E family twin arginine-targeting protein translocase [Synechococcus sp. HK01-R]QNG28002.1 TatA/E family twin arginine-targeting protein translocase [Synechococcus sp. HK01-R]